MYALIFHELKEMAKNYGYNLVLHGSLNRDMDLIAIPWTDEPKNEQEMIKDFQVYLTGKTMITADGNVHYTILPGNRHSYAIDLNRGSTKGEWTRYSEPEDDEQYYLDISVVQLARREVAEMPTAEGAEMDIYKSAVEFVKKAFTDLTHDEWQKLIDVIMKHTTLYAQRLTDKMVSERKYTAQDIDLAYTTGVFNVAGIDGLGKELKRLKSIDKKPHDIFRIRTEGGQQ